MYIRAHGKNYPADRARARLERRRGAVGKRCFPENFPRPREIDGERAIIKLRCSQGIRYKRQGIVFNVLIISCMITKFNSKTRPIDSNKLQNGCGKW